ncbi:MAG: stage 0 sporulation protein, partial [Hominimerdicola sp.]
MNIIGVRFKRVGKIYYFNPAQYEVHVGDSVIVETARGVECGEIVLADRDVDEESFGTQIKPIIRPATEQDFKTVEKNKQKEKDAFKI